MFLALPLLLLCAVLVTGCNDRSTRVVEVPGLTVTPPPAPTWRDEFAGVDVVPPGAWSSTLAGVDTWVPSWLARVEYTTLRAAALDEIDNTEAEQDLRPGYNVVGYGRFGPPPGYRVVGMDPGAFSFSASPTGLANGYVDLNGRGLIYVAWRATSGDPRRYPALAHEYGHAWAYVLTGDVLLASQHGHPATAAAGGGDLHCAWGFLGAPGGL